MKLTKRQLKRIIREAIQQRGVSERGAVWVGTGNFYVSAQPDGEIYIEDDDGNTIEYVYWPGGKK